MPATLRAVIHDVDESLRALASREALEGSRVDVAFDAPTREWAARQNAPTVSLYLYDIREDLQRREVAWEPVRGPDGIVTEHRTPPRRFRLSYMITAWTQRPEDEHRLLSAMLGCFLRHPYLPPELLTGALVDTTTPILMTIGLPPPPDRALADVWSALGGELKPSLDLVVTAPMDASVRIEAAPPVLEGPRLRMARPDGLVDGVVDGGGGSVTFAGRPSGRRGPLSPTEPAAQEEIVTAAGPARGERAEAGAAPADERPPKGRRKGGKSEPPKVTGAPTPSVPGRRIIFRGVRRP